MSQIIFFLVSTWLSSVLFLFLFFLTSTLGFNHSYLNPNLRLSYQTILLRTDAQSTKEFTVCCDSRKQLLSTLTNITTHPSTNSLDLCTLWLIWKIALLKPATFPPSSKSSSLSRTWSHRVILVFYLLHQHTPHNPHHSHPQHHTPHQ